MAQSGELYTLENHTRFQMMRIPGGDSFSSDAVFVTVNEFSPWRTLIHAVNEITANRSSDNATVHVAGEVLGRAALIGVTGMTYPANHVRAERLVQNIRFTLQSRLCNSAREDDKPIAPCILVNHDGYQVVTVDGAADGRGITPAVLVATNAEYPRQRTEKAPAGVIDGLERLKLAPAIAVRGRAALISYGSAASYLADNSILAESTKLLTDIVQQEFSKSH